MVQIYQNEELNDIMFEVEALDEWKSINEELGLVKQMSFTETAESPIPYPWINGGMDRIFSTLCPTKVDFKKYDKTPIPLEVLKQLRLSVNERHFGAIEIWYDDKTPDPFAVGVTAKWCPYAKDYHRMKDADGKDMEFDSEAQAMDYCKTIGFEYKGAYQTDVKKYLIARWADVVRPIAELKELARERLIERYGAEFRNELEKVTTALKKINENVTLFLNGEITESQLKGEIF